MFWAIVIAVIAIVAVFCVFPKKNGHCPPSTFLLLLLLPLSVQAGKLEDKLPPLEGLVRYGCAVNGPIAMLDRNSPDGRMHDFWSVMFWAEHQSSIDKKPKRDWKLVYSYRKKRMKGLIDCDKFMERVKKAAKRFRNPK